MHYVGEDDIYFEATQPRSMLLPNPYHGPHMDPTHGNWVAGRVEPDEENPGKFLIAFTFDATVTGRSTGNVTPAALLSSSSFQISDYKQATSNWTNVSWMTHLRPAELDLFSTAPESPWSEALYKECAEKTALGGLSFDEFLAQVKSLANLVYIGYQGDIASVLRMTRRRRLDCKKQQSDKNVFQCFVFGPKGVGGSHQTVFSEGMVLVEVIDELNLQ
ncbi:hypothetical protein MKW98_023765 [Papaver atlanticum]|uniref:Uncharacterized protein n=1 Tax=Papaver atlanticum TaxID=357466 RepID=A0AAD4SZF6_9MAGN|nr:hypothetical protein MKW98_023765 [Papaver atlanticum]